MSNVRAKINYIGPFVDGTALKQALKVLRKVFPYRTCQVMPRKPCLWYQLERCPAPCTIKLAKSLLLHSGRVLAQKERELKKTCRKNVKNLVKILQGKKTLVLKNLKKEMQLASRAQNFEKAAKLRDQATALKSILEHSRLSAKIYPGSQGLQNWPAAETALRKLFSLKKKIKRIEGYDVSNIQGQEATGSMVVFEDGQPKKEHYRKFRVKISGKSNDTAMLKEVLERRFGHYEWKLPDLILIDGGVGQLSAALQIKNQKSKIKNTNQKSKIKRIKFAAIVKRKNELYIENKKSSFLLKELPQDVSNLILRVRDESHRFAISYHKKLRKRVLFGN